MRRGSGLQKIRAANLRLLHQTYSWDEIASEVGTVPGYLSQIAVEYVGKGRKSPRALSDQMAEHIEKRLGLQSGWMDEEHAAAPGEDVTGGVDLDGSYDTGPEIGRRIRGAIEAAGVNQAWVAKALGVTPQSVGQWCRSGSISRANIYALTQILGVDPGDLLRDGEGTVEPQPRRRLSFDGGEVSISPGAAGADAFALRVNGSSMAPAIPPAAVIIVDPDEVAEDGDYVVASIPGAGRVPRRVLTDGEQAILVAEADGVPASPVGGDVQIEGRIVEMVVRF